MADTPSPELTGILRIVDQATAPLRKIAEQIRGVGRAAREAGEETEHLHHHGLWGGLHENVNLLGEHFGELRASIGETNESMAELLPMLGAFGEAAAAAGIVEMVNRVANARTQLMATATAIGITAEQLEQLNYTATMTNVPIETLQTAVGRLEKNIGAAVSGKSKLAVALFEHMHIALRDAHGATRSVTDILPQLADAFAHTHDKAMLAFATTSLFGRAGLQLLPMLMRGSAAMRDFAEQADKINYPFTEADDAALERFHQGWQQLGLAMEAFENEVGAKLAPVLTPILTGLTHWVTANRDWIATKIVGAVQQLVGWSQQLIATMSRFDWAGAIHQAEGWANALGGVQTVLIALTVLMGSPLLIGMVALLRAIVSLGSGLAVMVRVAGTVIAAIGGPMIAAVVEFVAALRLGFTAVESLSLLFAANPLGVVLLAIGLLIVAGYELWQHWSAVSAGFSAIWGFLVGLWTRNVGYIRTICELLFLPVEEIIRHWAPIQGFFAAIWQAIIQAFQGGWIVVSDVARQLKQAIDWIASTWVGKGLSVAVNAVSGGVRAVAGKVGEQVQGYASIADAVAGNVPASLDQIYNVQPAVAPIGGSAAADTPLGAPAARPIIPSPYSSAAPNAAANAATAPMTGKVETLIRFEGLPAGATVTSTADGIAAAPVVDTGQNYPAGRAIGR